MTFSSAEQLLFLAAEMDRLLEQMGNHQRAKVFRAAQALRPTITEEDIAQPHDIPELRDNASWNYEDGVLAGILCAQMAIRSTCRALALPSNPGASQP